MPYWRLYYHIVWATKERQSFLTPEIEAVLYPIIGAKCSEKRGQPFAVNGMPDHVHLITTVPPSVALSDFVKHVKGASSHVIAEKFDMPFAWQRGYGVFTISQRNLEQALAYVRRQKEHHQAGSVIAALERVSDEDDGPRLQRPPDDESSGYE